jgi:hypothetical protein
VIVGLLGLPALLPGFLSLKTGDPAIAREAARISVLFANPFHQDPAFFLTALIGLRVIVIAAGAILLWRALPGDPIRQLVPAFLGVLAVFFAAGLVARGIEAYGVLQYYPFRVADGLFPLFFWLGAALLFQRWYERRPQVLRFLLIPVVLGLSGWLIDQTRATPRFRGPSGFTEALLTTEPRLTAFWIRSQAEHWSARLAGRQTAFERLEQWARLNTPADAVFITPPWEITWPIASERAAWISFKIIAPGPSLPAWKQRFEALHGRPFTQVGFGILKQLRESYPALTAERARALTRIGPARYLVALTDVAGLALVHREDDYRVYALGETP